MSDEDTKLTTSDAELVARARLGDTSAFGELWRRHYRPAVRVARQFTSIDADDLVSEAYTRIYQRVLAGGGPTGAFRPYLYTTIRNLASSWGAASRDIQVDMIEDFEDERIPGDPAADALDRTLTAQAFRGLPDRWQTVLWYTEVEGMDPHEVAPLMGLTANGVAALSYRAREGLRKAWLQAHITDATASGECQWTMGRLGEHARDGLSNRDKQRLEAHLATCSKCQIVSEEVEEVGSHLAMVMLPLLLGGVIGGSLLASLSQPASVQASQLAADVIPQLPDAVQAVAAGTALAAPVVGGLSLGATAGTGALVGGLALAAALGGGVLISTSADGGSGADGGAGTGSGGSSTGSDSSGSDAESVLPPETEEPTSPPPSPSPSAVPAIPTETEDDEDDESDEGDDLVDTVVDTISGDDDDRPEGHDAPNGVVGATVSLDLSGSGTPGAHVSLQAAGVVYATTTIDKKGKFSLSVDALPQGIGSLDLVQDVDESLLGGLVGDVVDLLKPLKIKLLDDDGAGIDIDIIE
jgi:RNA polymerase sigma factor (sigma-70 family)